MVTIGEGDSWRPISLSGMHLTNREVLWRSNKKYLSGPQAVLTWCWLVLAFAWEKITFLAEASVARAWGIVVRIYKIKNSGWQFWLLIWYFCHVTIILSYSDTIPRSFGTCIDISGLAIIILEAIKVIPTSCSLGKICMFIMGLRKMHSF